MVILFRVVFSVCEYSMRVSGEEGGVIIIDVCVYV